MCLCIASASWLDKFFLVDVAVTFLFDCIWYIVAIIVCCLFCCSDIFHNSFPMFYKKSILKRFVTGLHVTSDVIYILLFNDVNVFIDNNVCLTTGR